MSRWVVWAITRLFYRVRTFNADRVPSEGPALLICNHVSFADALLVSDYGYGAATPATISSSKCTCCFLRRCRSGRRMRWRQGSNR